MIISTKKGTPKDELEKIVDKFEKQGLDVTLITGKANLVEPMMIAAVAAGADGLEVEVHYDPQHAWSDGAQCLTPDAFAQAMAKCRQVAWAIGRDM